MPRSLRWVFGWSLLIVVIVGATRTATAVAAHRPNIRSVTVSRDRAGMFRFVIGFTGRVGLGSETRLEVMLDTDRDSNTGVQGGEYALDYSSAEEEAAPRPSLLTAQDGDAYGSSPSSLLFPPRLTLSASRSQRPTSVTPRRSISGSSLSRTASSWIPPRRTWSSPPRPSRGDTREGRCRQRALYTPSRGTTTRATRV